MFASSWCFKALPCLPLLLKWINNLVLFFLLVKHWSAECFSPASCDVCCSHGVVSGRCLLACQPVPPLLLCWQDAFLLITASAHILPFFFLLHFLFTHFPAAFLHPEVRCLVCSLEKRLAWWWSLEAFITGRQTEHNAFRKTRIPV